MPLLYHYTNKAGMDGIYSRNMIEAREPTDCSSDGPGVYFTEMPPPPANTKEAILANNYGIRANNGGIDRNRARYWFKFELLDLPSGTVQLGTEGNRNIWKCPVSVPIQCDNPRRMLYHYTDKKGKDGIVADGVIKSVRPHGGVGIGSRMPIGVYFTEMRPDSLKEDLLFNMFGTQDTSNKEFMEKTTYWFKFFENDVPSVYQRKTLKNRNEWVCEQDVPMRSYSGPGCCLPGSRVESVSDVSVTSSYLEVPFKPSGTQGGCDGDGCQERAITGFRYLCLECEDFNLCANCAVKNDTHTGDYMLRISKPISQENVLELFKTLLSKISKYQKVSKTSLGAVYHKDVSCKGCETTTPRGMKGYRFKCLECSNYDLCASCEANECHKEHVMLRIAKPTSEVQKLLKSLTKSYKRHMLKQ